MRVFMTHTLSDVMSYQSSVNSQVFKELCDNLNKTYQSFCNEYPTFSGNCSILAHSIASTACWDLLTFQAPKQRSKYGNVEAWKQNSNWKEVELSHKPESLQLQFQVENFFMVGSYTSVILSFKGESPASQKFPQCNSFYNIFFPNDSLVCLDHHHRLSILMFSFSFFFF